MSKKTKTIFPFIKIYKKTYENRRKNIKTTKSAAERGFRVFGGSENRKKRGEKHTKKSAEKMLQLRRGSKKRELET
jgi:hypothetical protein